MNNCMRVSRDHRDINYTDYISFSTCTHRRRVLFNPGEGAGGCVHIQIPVSWVGGGKHCKLHAFVHIYIEGT